MAFLGVIGEVNLRRRAPIVKVVCILEQLIDEAGSGGGQILTQSGIVSVSIDVTQVDQQSSNTRLQHPLERPAGQKARVLLPSPDLKNMVYRLLPGCWKPVVVIVKVRCWETARGRHDVMVVVNCR